MSQAQESQISPEERNSESNENREPLMEEGRVNTGRLQRDERKRNYVAVVLSLLAVVLVMGAIVVPQWSRMVSLDGTVIGEYGLFVVKLLKVKDGNDTNAQYQNLFEFFNPGELSLILCILIVLLFNVGLEISGVVVSFGCCPSYLNFLASFSVFNLFAVINYFAIMGLWLWITDRLPFHNLDDPIRTQYPDVTVEFDYGYYLVIAATGLLTLSAVANILYMSLHKSGCFRSKNSSSNTVIMNPLATRQIIRRVRVQLPLEPPEYREELSPETSPIAPPTIPPHLISGNTSFIH